jgi:hypothetical protein
MYTIEDKNNIKKSIVKYTAAYFDIDETLNDDCH